MESEIRRLLDKAFRIIPGGDFNAVRYEMTRDPEQTFVCETAIPGEATWNRIKEDVYPPLCRYWKSKRIDPLSPGRVVVAVFHGEHCYLMHGSDFIQAFCENEKIDRFTFRKIFSFWVTPSSGAPVPSPSH